MGCKGKCDHHKFRMLHKIKGLGGATNSYKNGWKKCTECGISVFTEGLYCPCCNFKLRARPRSGRTKLEKQKITVTSH